MLGLASNTAPLQRQTLVDSVYQHVLNAILSGRLAAGTEFSEVGLARELGVSRTPVHEALAWLASTVGQWVPGAEAGNQGAAGDVAMPAEGVADLLAHADEFFRL